MSNKIARASFDFNSDSDKPLPLIVAERWGFPLRYVTENETNLYAIRDWIKGLTNTVDPKRTWQSLRTLPDMQPALERIRHIHLPGTSGSPTQVVDDRGLYLIAANLRGLKNRGPVVEIKDFLAKAGAFADLARLDPEAAELALQQRRQSKYLKQGKPPEWIAVRELGIVTRKQLMGVVHDLLGTGDHMAAVTNDTYQGVFGMTAAELRAHIGIPSNAVVRDHFSTMALVYTQAAEEACRITLEKYDDDDVVEVQDIRAVVSTLSRIVGKQVKEMAKTLGIDIVTGKPLLGTGLTREEFFKALEKASRPVSKLNPFSGDE